MLCVLFYIVINAIDNKSIVVIDIDRARIEYLKNNYQNSTYPQHL